MQISLTSRCVGSVVYLDHRLSNAIKPDSVDCGNHFAAYTHPMKRISRNSHSLYSHSTLKPSLGIEKYYGETIKRASPVIVNATSFPDKGGEDINDKRKSAGSYNVLSVFAGVISNMIKFVINFLSLEKKYLGKFEDKIDNAVDVVEEVADTVKQVAKFTEEIAEKVEQHSKEVAVVYEAAAFVDNMSEKVAKEAEIVENGAEQIKKTLKSIGTDMEAVEGAAEDIEDRLSKAITNAEVVAKNG